MINLALKNSIAIIGSGFSGISVSHYTSHDIDHPILWIGKDHSLGPAYEHACEEHLLNVPAKKMSAFVYKKNNFIDYVEKNIYKNEENISEKFVSRAIYKNYLSHIREKIIKKPCVKFVNDEILDVLKENDGYSLITNDRKYYAKYVVLALGQKEPQKLSAESDDLIIQNPWGYVPWERIISSKNVLIVGSGLSTVDQILSLKKRQYKGNIHILSSSGKLPEKYLDLQILNIAKPSFSFKELSSWIQEKKDYYHPQQIISMVRLHMQDLWFNWSPLEKNQFYKDLFLYYDKYRHCISPEAYHEVHKTPFHILKGTFSHAVNYGKGLKVFYSTKSVTSGIEVDWILNCTGPSDSLTHPLIKKMVNRKILQADEFGIITDKIGRIRDENIYAMGPLCRGSLFEITAVPEIREQAAKIAADMKIEVKKPIFFSSTK